VVPRRALTLGLCADAFDFPATIPKSRSSSCSMPRRRSFCGALTRRATSYVNARAAPAAAVGAQRSSIRRGAAPASALCRFLLWVTHRNNSKIGLNRTQIAPLVLVGQRWRPAMDIARLAEHIGNLRYEAEYRFESGAPYYQTLREGDVRGILIVRSSGVSSGLSNSAQHFRIDSRRCRASDCISSRSVIAGTVSRSTSALYRWCRASERSRERTSEWHMIGCRAGVRCRSAKLEPTG
jgi:hypothetical protein